MSSNSKKRKGDGIRAPHAKTRTGCVTCKARRVKCDEAKPSCNRCRNFGVACDGYDTSSIKSRSNVLQSLVPLGRRDGTMALVEAKQSAVPIIRQPGSVRFESEREARYFNFYSTDISQHLGGCFDPELWPGSFLRASESFWPLRKGLIALGALDLTSPAGLSQIREGPKKENITENYLFALQEYSRFINGVKQIIAADDIRTQLLASILIVLFEAYLGNSKSVQRQVSTSSRMLDQWKKKHARPWTADSLLSPAPNVVEDELIHFFERLDLEVITQSDPLSQEEHMIRKDTGAAAIAHMPEEFTNVRQARMYGNLLHRRLVHLLNAYDDKSSPDISIWDRVSGVASPELLSELEVHKQHFLQWSRSFEPLFKRAWTPDRPKDWNWNKLAIIRVHYLVLIMMFESVFQQNETFYDSFHNEFVEMLDICKALLFGVYSNFTLSDHSVLVLDIIAKKCRDPVMRREAIRLLLEKPRREAFWDSIMSGNISQWIMEVEEEGMIDGYIPEESRARKIGGKFDFMKKEAHLWCYKPTRRGNLVNLEKREATISWTTIPGSLPGLVQIPDDVDQLAFRSASHGATSSPNLYMGSRFSCSVMIKPVPESADTGQ